MKSIFLIFAVVVWCNSLAAYAAENYSLWPRRPAELEQARRLIGEQKLDEAVQLLSPYLSEKGIAGREARQIVGAVHVRKYLSRQHPGATVYQVQRGDTIAQIARKHQCPVDMVMLLNGIVEPSNIKMGQKLVIVPMRLRLEISLSRREAMVWDGDVLVADYDLVGVPERKMKEETTQLAVREGYVDGHRLSARAMSFGGSDRVLVLSNGIRLTASPNAEGDCILMEQRDLNELALLLAPKAEVALFDFDSE